MPRTPPPDSIAILDRLIGFPTISRHSNAALMGYVGDLLAAAGIAFELVVDPHGGNHNLSAVVGPADRPGVMLSGHTDVVPVAGQAWTSEPFRMMRRGDRLFGRGVADMKGFVACAIRAACLAAERPLVEPLRLSLSCDEEIGCVGVRSLIEMLARAPVRPALCIVGEPTSMRVATGHKGKVVVRARFHGSGGHSASAPVLLSAIHLATDFIARLRARQQALAQGGESDDAYEVPYTTVHVGLIRGGEALNIVPATCEVDFELRLLAAEDPDRLIAAIRADADAIVAPYRAAFPQAAVTIETLNAYPGIDTPHEDPAVAFVTALLGANELIKVDFGTEAGLFHRDLGTPTVICGPGSMTQGHKADEYLEIAQLDRCDRMLAALVDRLCRPLASATQRAFQ